MTTYQKHKVVMLRSKNESGCFSYTPKGILHTNLLIGSPHHLYILSDEEIKEGDWYLDISLINSLFIIPRQALSNIKRIDKNCKKIIATTDQSIGVVKYTEGGHVINAGQKILLPEIPQQFIEYYINEYNKGNELKEVEVEYINNGDIDFGYGIEYIIRYNSDNTINIKPTLINFDTLLEEWEEQITEKRGEEYANELFKGAQSVIEYIKNKKIF